MCLQYWRARGRPERRPAADLAGRLLRGHPHPDVALRPGRRDAPPVERRSCPARCSPTRRPDGFDAPADAGYVDHLAGAGRGARRRARGDHRGAGGAGRGRHALPQPGLPRRPAGARRRARPAAGVRRDRDRLRAQRGAVRGRPRRRGPRRDVRRQGDDRRLPDDGRHPLHGARWPRRSPPARCPCWPTARPSWAIRSPRPWPTRPSTCCSPRTGEAEVSAGRGRPAGGAGAGGRPSGRGRRAGARGDRRRPARPRGQRGGGVPGGGRARRVAAALPRPRLHDAPLRDGRRRPGGDRRRRVAAAAVG